MGGPFDGNFDNTGRGELPPNSYLVAQALEPGPRPGEPGPKPGPGTKTDVHVDNRQTNNQVVRTGDNTQVVRSGDTNVQGGATNVRTGDTKYFSSNVNTSVPNVIGSGDCSVGESLGGGIAFLGAGISLSGGKLRIDEGCRKDKTFVAGMQQACDQSNANAIVALTADQQLMQVATQDNLASNPAAVGAATRAEQIATSKTNSSVTFDDLCVEFVETLGDNRVTTQKHEAPQGTNWGQVAHDIRYKREEEAYNAQLRAAAAARQAAPTVIVFPIIELEGQKRKGKK